MRHISEMYTVKGGKLRKHIIIHPESDSDSGSDSDEEGKGLYAGGSGGGLYGGTGLYAGRGGSIGSKMKSAFNKAGSYITAKKGGLASALVNNGIPAVTGALGGMAGSEFGPLGGFAGSQLGSLGGKYLANYVDSKAGTGMRGRGRPRKSQSAGDLIHIDVGSHNARRDMNGGKLKMDLVKAYNKVVPKSMQPAVNELAGQVGNYALDKAGYSGNPIPVKGGKLKNDLVKAYNKVVPKSMQPAVNNLAGQVGNYALKSAGYGEPIPVGKGFKKGSQEAKDHMARIRAMRKK
jgi:hypothetical protein